MWKWLKTEFRWRILGERYEVVMTDEAKQQLSELSEHEQEEILKTIDRISKNPYTSDRLQSSNQEAS